MSSNDEESTMEAFNARLRRLEGRTLRTVSGRPFDVVDVDDKGVVVVPRHSGIPRSRIQWWRFQRAADAGLLTATVIPAQLQRADVTHRNSAYIAALIRAIS